MTEEFPRPIHFVAATLAALVAAIHLGLGIFEWARRLTVGILLPSDLRWPLFVLSGTVLAVGIVAAARNWYPRRRLYAGGLVLSLGYALGYFGWHLAGHPVLGVGGHHHEFDPVVFLVDHLFAGPVEFVSIVLELALVAALAYLLGVDRP